MTKAERVSSLTHYAASAFDGFQLTNRSPGPEITKKKSKSCKAWNIVTEERETMPYTDTREVHSLLTVSPDICYEVILLFLGPQIKFPY
jgi:hypothetical protein